MISYKVNTLKLTDPRFPVDLANIHAPPKQLFCLGMTPDKWYDSPRISIVGSRKVTPYGSEVTKHFASALSRRGVVIISGMAFGVDSVAHQASLDAGGRTVAVLPSSVEEPYPASHRNLARQIVQNDGALLSEYPKDTVSFRDHFIARNRLISGLSEVLLITEAAANSGSLHTARFALEQGKTVMAVPGNINNPLSEGCNNLIKSGAVPATKLEDVLFALNVPVAEKSFTTIYRGAPEEENLLELIRGGLKSQEDLALASKLDGPAITSALTALEIAGAIKPEGNGVWSAS